MISSTRSKTKKILIVFTYVVLAFIIVGYAIYTSRNLIMGPSLIIETPTDGETFSSSTIKVIGTALRIKDISINDRPVTISDTGRFEEDLVLFKGYNVLNIKISDKFGRSLEKNLQLINID